MKVTGVILALIGLVAGVICLVVWNQPTNSSADAGAPPVDQVSGPNMALPLAACAAAVVIGLLMFVFGGKGYFVSNNPRVRN